MPAALPAHRPSTSSNEPEHLPSGIGPAPPESLLNGCVLAEVDDLAVPFGTVALPGAVVDLGQTWVTTQLTTAWDVEQLDVRPGSPMYVVCIRLTVTRADRGTAAVPGGLVLKLPKGRVNLGLPLPEHASDRRASDHANVA